VGDQDFLAVLGHAEVIGLVEGVGVWLICGAWFLPDGRKCCASLEWCSAGKVANLSGSVDLAAVIVSWDGIVSWNSWVPMMETAD